MKAHAMQTNAIHAQAVHADAAHSHIMHAHLMHPQPMLYLHCLFYIRTNREMPSFVVGSKPA
jgi:hypothetical protein